jgi:SAM-dependent methyltransferase
MQEILDHLPKGARVLDLGSKEGSFSADDYPGLVIVTADLSKPDRPSRFFAQANAASLPFPARLFDAVILNHSLEHFDALKPALQEVGRVVRSDGAVYVAVPDATTLSDRVYRKLYLNRGGHVNLFGSEPELARMLSWYFGLPHHATRILCSSYTFLNRRNHPDLAERRQMRFSGLPEPLLLAFTGILRCLDWRFRRRFSVYGWALYFGKVGEPVDPAVRSNICIRCGQAHPAAWLKSLGLVRKNWFGLRTYTCPHCGARALYSSDRPK